MTLIGILVTRMTVKLRLVIGDASYLFLELSEYFCFRPVTRVATILTTLQYKQIGELCLVTEPEPTPVDPASHAVQNIAGAKQGIVMKW